MDRTAALTALFQDTRKESERICEPLSTEDYVVQPIVDVSPPKWHLGHTTWFFEEFILKRFRGSYRPYHPEYAFVFNSYYETVGARVIRSDRGNLSRPGVREVYRYRDEITGAVLECIEQTGEEQREELLDLLEIGIHHEKQHQELLLTDIKYILGNNPLQPAYTPDFSEGGVQMQEEKWIPISEGMYSIGHAREGFCYDNEKQAHRVFLNAFEISNRLVRNDEFLEFMGEGGYRNHNYWHSEAWAWLEETGTEAPLYWHRIDGRWKRYGLSGLSDIEPGEAVTHISYYEAFAYAQWKGMRLPTEFEWEASQDKFSWGSRWEWTESAYLPYPGYTREEGALGEYNGKFMVNQKVLRGASVATPTQHSRPTYRNFFHPQLRWQFTGFRLAKNP